MARSVSVQPAIAARNRSCRPACTTAIRARPGAVRTSQEAAVGLVGLPPQQPGVDRRGHQLAGPGLVHAEDLGQLGDPDGLRGDRVQDLLDGHVGEGDAGRAWGSRWTARWPGTG